MDETKKREIVLINAHLSANSLKINNQLRFWKAFLHSKNMLKIAIHNPLLNAKQVILMVAMLLTRAQRSITNWL